MVIVGATASRSSCSDHVEHDVYGCLGINLTCVTLKPRWLKPQNLEFRHFDRSVSPILKKSWRRRLLSLRHKVITSPWIVMP